MACTLTDLQGIDQCNLTCIMSLICIFSGLQRHYHVNNCRARKVIVYATTGFYVLMLSCCACAVFIFNEIKYFSVCSILNAVRGNISTVIIPLLYQVLQISLCTFVHWQFFILVICTVLELAAVNLQTPVADFKTIKSQNENN